MSPALCAQGYGGLRIGAMQLALPMTALREVVPCTGLVTLPAAAACIVGGITLRGVMLPVLDLQIVLGRAPTVQDRAIVIVLVHDGRLLGLLADAVTGVFAGRAGSLHAARADDPVARVLAGSLCREDEAAPEGGTLSLLSPEALAALPGVPMIDDPEPEREHAHDVAVADAEADPERQLLLLRVGGLMLAIDAMSVFATLAHPEVQPSPLAMGHCRGVVTQGGRGLPMVDLLSLCGLGRLPPGAAPQAFVVHCAGGPLGLLVDEVLDVVGARASDLVPVPAFALPQPQLFRGALPGTALRGASVQRDQYLVLDSAALTAHVDLAALAETARGGATLPGFGEALDASAGRRPMITFEIGCEAATPLDAVAEILRYTPSSAVFSDRGPLLGMLAHRGRCIPLLCLQQLTRGTAATLTPEATVLVVQSQTQSETQWVGFVVPRLCSIEAALWEPELPLHGGGGAPTPHKMALVGQGTNERLLQVHDLAQRAATLLAA